MSSRRLPSLHAVRAFEAAARHLSITHAARELNVTPGAVSRHVRALEEDLKAPLFVRRSTGLELTPVGRSMADGSREALDRLEEAATGVRLQRHRRLSIGVYGHFFSRALLPLLSQLRRSHPTLEVDVHASTNPLDILPSRFDAVIVVAGAGRQSGLVMRPLMPITTVAVAAPQRLKKGPVDFSRVPLLHTRPRSEDWRRWLDYAGFGAVPVRGGSSFESASQTLEAAASGLGLAIAIECLLGPDLASGRLAIAHPTRRPTRRHFALQYEPRFADDPSLITFADWMCERLLTP
jgi:LysR family transcriptional regulator, glycine cleavage system transcriptional activator